MTIQLKADSTTLWEQPIMSLETAILSGMLLKDPMPRYELSKLIFLFIFRYILIIKSSQIKLKLKNNQLL